MPKTDNLKKIDIPPVAKFFLVMLLAIFATEAAIMSGLYFFLSYLRLPPLWEGFLDSLTLAVLLTPVLYFLFYRPLSLQIARYKQALETIQGLKTGYGVIVRTAMDGFWLIDIQGRILEVNDSYCRLIGYSREELLTMSVFDLRANEKPEDTKRHLQRIIASGSDRFESHHRGKDGRIVDLEVSVNYLDAEGGRLFAFLHDITERKKRQRELEEANVFNSSLVQTIPFGMDIVDKEGNILWLNPRLESVFGKEAIGKKCWELYRDDKLPCDNCPLIGDIALGETATIEISGVLGGRSFQISHIGMVYQGKMAILEIFQDITERKQNQAMLEKLAVAVRQTADMVVITDKDGKIEYVNPAFELETGYKAEEAIGQTPRILKSGQHDQGFYERLWQTILADEVFRDILVNKKKDGQLYYSEKTITPIKDEHGVITNFVSNDKDITTRKLAEEELLKLNRELIKLDQLKSGFINMSSHELRTPIAIIREGISQIVEGLHGELKPEQKYFLDKSFKNVNRLIKIVDNIFEISGLDSEKAFLEKESFDMVELARSAIAGLDPEIKGSGLEIRENFPRNKVELNVDRKKINRVLTELIRNALKFTEKGYIEIKIEDREDRVECAVKDTGIGIAEENLPAVFDKFQQFDRDFGPGERGTGLGLAIAKGLIELHKGKIWVESRMGEGSKFTLSLPKGK
ncbi:MAG: PAS domain S-box protein [Candidatus Omnitrophota bacterium]|nr:PAS domain S-box protein [Candidatus Omnitrophota bacterium]